MKQTIVITGAAGYIGLMLVRKFAARPDIEKIIGIDMEPLPDLLKAESKLHYIQDSIADIDLTEEVGRFNPDMVIHTAWQIREMYGQKNEQWKRNITSSQRIFDFVFKTDSVTKLIYFSTVSSYGAFPDNSVDTFIPEDQEFQEEVFLYGREKRSVELHLKKYYEQAEEDNIEKDIFVIRPASITGPRGRFMRTKFNLQSALSGRLKKSFLHRCVSLAVSVMPITKKWCRQFIHEDDVVNIVEHLGFESTSHGYNVYNISPPGPVVTGEDMANIVGKKSITVPASLLRPIFFIAWHITRGKIPTSHGGWRFYAYPIAVDGSKITKDEGYTYMYDSRAAISKTDGEYEEFI